MIRRRDPSEWKMSASLKMTLLLGAIVWVFLALLAYA